MTVRGETARQQDDGEAPEGGGVAESGEKERQQQDWTARRQARMEM